MKKLLSLSALAILLAAGTVFTGCQTAAQKTDTAQTRAEEAKQQEMMAIQHKDSAVQAQKVADAEAWKTFKSESEIKIKYNDIRIAELKTKMKTSVMMFDTLSSQKIATLERKNKDMTTRIEAYERSQSVWETFKREFTYDMNEIGKAINEATSDNKK